MLNISDIQLLFYINILIFTDNFKLYKITYIYELNYFTKNEYSFHISDDINTLQIVRIL